MSDNEGTPSDAKALAWTEEARYQFLLRIVAQLKEDGKNINWQRLKMPGRTTKSLQNMWTKVNKSIAELDENGGSVPTTPVETPPKKGTPRKPRVKKSEAIVKDDESDEKNGAVKKAVKKRTSGAKKVKIEHGNDDLELKGDESVNLGLDNYEIEV